MTIHLLLLFYAVLSLLSYLFSLWVDLCFCCIVADLLCIFDVRNIYSLTLHQAHVGYLADLLYSFVTHVPKYTVNLIFRLSISSSNLRSASLATLVLIDTASLRCLLWLLSKMGSCWNRWVNRECSLCCCAKRLILSSSSNNAFFYETPRLLPIEFSRDSPFPVAVCSLCSSPPSFQNGIPQDISWICRFSWHCQFIEKCFVYRRLL